MTGINRIKENTQLFVAAHGGSSVLAHPISSPERVRSVGRVRRVQRLLVSCKIVFGFMNDSNFIVNGFLLKRC